MPLQISEKVMALAAQAQAGLRDQFDRIDSIAEENTRKVLAAFQKHRVAEAYFAGTTGYGYDDLGRDKLDEIFAELFGTEDALVRVQFVNGTHAISCALFGALKPAPAEPASFEDRLKQFMAASDSKLSELRQSERRSSRRGGRK